jgi:hypothetical protein
LKKQAGGTGTRNITAGRISNPKQAVINSGIKEMNLRGAHRNREEDNSMPNSSKGREQAPDKKASKNSAHLSKVSQTSALRVANPIFASKVRQAQGHNRVSSHAGRMV